jgi:hypothetical protein
MRFRRSVIACIGSFKLLLRAAEEEEEALPTLASRLFWRRCRCSPRDDVAEKKISSPLGKKEEHKINEEDVFFLLVVAIPLPKLAVVVCLEEEEEEEEDEENERRSASETAPPLLLTADDCRNNISSLRFKNGINKNEEFC